LALLDAAADVGRCGTGWSGERTSVSCSDGPWFYGLNLARPNAVRLYRSTERGAKTAT
jgi:hypothetical protein